MVTSSCVFAVLFVKHFQVRIFSRSYMAKQTANKTSRTSRNASPTVTHRVTRPTRWSAHAQSEHHWSSILACHKVRAHLHPATARCLRRRCDTTPNGLQSHFQVTDKFDADAWCNRTEFIHLILERSRSSVANTGCKRALRETSRTCFIFLNR